MKTERDIFRQGSTTYYWSSTFFPKKIRDDVFKLYSFVRVADDYVDDKPQQPKLFQQLTDLYHGKRVRNPSAQNVRVVEHMHELSCRYDFKPVWVEDFLASMQADLEGKQYKTLDDSLWYVEGSAEVIGLMMSQIMGLPKEAHAAAKMQGRAMQWINFVRDIEEDNQLGRCYFPQEELQAFGLPNLQKQTAKQSPEAFRDFILLQIARYEEWQAVATTGFKHIPKRLRVPLQTAVDMYNWTAREIAKYPQKVYEGQIKPSKQQVVARAGRNMIRG